MTQPDRPEVQADEFLVQAAQKGDTQAFNALIQRHYGAVFAVAYARLTDPEVCEDLAQEVFLRAWLQIASLRDHGRFGPWVTQMARHLATDWQRRGERQSRIVSLVPMEETVERISSSSGSEPGKALAERQEQELARRALELLPEDLREVAMLHYVEGLSKSDIARQLGVHPSTVGRQLDSAVAQMKKSVESGLRRPSPQLRPRPLAPARAMALVAAAAALTPEAKAAVVSAAAQSAAAPAVTATAATAASAGSPLSAFLASSWAAIITGVTTMGTGKTIALATVVAASLAGGAWYYEANGGVLHGNGVASAEGANDAAGTATGKGSEIVQDLGSFIGKEFVFDLEYGRKYTLRVDPSNPLGLSQSSMMIESDGSATFESKGTWGENISRTKLPSGKTVTYLSGGHIGVYGTTTITMGEKSARVFSWMDYRPDVVEPQKELMKTFLAGSISGKTYRTSFVQMLRKHNVGPTDATERQRFYDQVMIDQEIPSRMPD